MKHAILLLAACGVCACAAHKNALDIEENRRAKLEMQSIMDMVASREIPPVEFESGSSLLASSYGILDRVAEILLSHPTLKLIVNGHTDEVGDARLNEELSLKRAAAAAQYLTDRRGIYPNRIRVNGYGHSRRITTDTSQRGRALNRRVEFVITTRDWETVF